MKFETKYDEGENRDKLLEKMDKKMDILLERK